MNTTPFLRRVEKADTCSGCGLCAAISPAIRMTDRPPGYARPQQTGPVAAADDAAIAAACPAIVVDERDRPHDADEPLWGPARFIGTGHATDPALRRQASSGGVISVLLAHALESGLVDFVVQTGADPDRPLGNRTGISHSRDDIMASAGSRYTASSPLERLEEWLALPGRVAFVGKPCDVTALRARARTDPRIDDRIPLMLAFFCAGIPSAAGTRRIIERLGAKPDDVASFRYRGDGWPGFATARLKDGSTRTMSYADSWGSILSKEVQFRCKICPDAVGAAADVACADAWYGDDRGYPSFEEAEGRSLVMARTPAGLTLVDSARAAGQLATEPLAVGEIIKMQPHQARRKRQVLSRLLAMRVVGRPVPAYRGVALREAAAREPLLAQAKSFAGLVRRFVQGRA